MPDNPKYKYRIYYFLLGKEENILENKIFNIATFIFVLLSLVLTISSFFYDTNLFVHVYLLVVTAFFGLTFYHSRFKNRFLLSSRLFVLFTLIFNDIAWFWSIAATPAANYFFILIVLVDLTILKVKDHLGFIVIVIFNISLVHFLAYYNPEFFINQHELLGRITFPFNGHFLLHTLLVLITIILFFFKKSYERERRMSLGKSRQLLNNNVALRNRNEHLESMARMTSHNLRSPMAGLKMLIRLLDVVKTPDEREELIEHFKEGAGALFEMIDDLSEVLLDYRELVKEKEDLELSVILERVKRQLAPQFYGIVASLESDFSKYPVVHYSRYFLESVFLNLLSNAIKYRSPDRPLKVMVRSYVRKRRLILSIADNGIGIDLEKYGHDIFKMYKTFHENEEVESRGIGLFISKNQVEIMGGKISVESTPGKGSTFYVELYRL